MPSVFETPPSTPTAPASEAPVLDTKTADAAMAQAADLSALPPAGDERREELKRRADALRKAAAELEAAGGFEAVDLSRIEPENEIAGAFDPLTRMLRVSNANEREFVYKWEQADLYGRHGNIWVTSSKSLGWEVVSGPRDVAPEAWEHRQADGTRRVGDAILMRIRRERYEALMARQRRINVARQEGIGVQLLEQAEKAGIPVHDLTAPSTPQHIINHAQATREAARAARAAFVHASPQARPGAQRAHASEIASRKLESAIRRGNVPGLAVGA